MISRVYSNLIGYSVSVGLLIGGLSLSQGKAYTIQEKDKSLLERTLYKIIAAKACVSSVRDETSPPQALAASIGSVKQQFPAVVKGIGGIDRNKSIKMFNQVCNIIYQKEIVVDDTEIRKAIIEERAKRVVKPLTVNNYTPASECKVDAYWLARLKRLAGFYIENRNCLIDVSTR